MKYTNKILIILLLLCVYSYSQVPSVRLEDKTRIREAIKIQDEVGNEVWDGITRVPITLLLITEDIEFLFNHPYPSSEFIFLENDTITKSNIYYRSRQFPVHLQAAFPAVNGVSCVVIGTPENTNTTSNQWILTVLHENFHQYQTSQPYYFKRVEALGLSGGDETGMWQLNYPFPYEDEKVNSSFSAYSLALTYAIEARNQENFATLVYETIRARNAFKNSVSEKDFAYFTFQIWQEGIARYTEFNYLKALREYIPTNEFENLKDYKPFTEMETKYFEQELEILKNQVLSEEQRLVVYSIGLAEGVLLDCKMPNWKNEYFSSLVSPFTLAK